VTLHKTPGARSFAFFAKGGIGKSLCRHLLIPPFAKSAKDGAPGGLSRVALRSKWTVALHLGTGKWMDTLFNAFGKSHGLEDRTIPGADVFLSEERGGLVYALTRICRVEYIRSVESVFEIIAEPNRRAILSLLVSSQRSVGEIERRLRMPQPTVSKHLRVLREAGFVESTIDAQRRLYRLRPEPLQEVDAWLAPFRRFWSAHVDALERHLDRLEHRPIDKDPLAYHSKPQAGLPKAPARGRQPHKQKGRRSNAATPANPTMGGNR
jgi:DNA-binding transcriptional ArsR family regulator